MTPDERDRILLQIDKDRQRFEDKLDAVLAISQRVETMATTVAGQIKPVLDDLMKSPLLKMLGVKSK